MSTQTADVIIIGGGIVGCSAAYFLASEGHRVTLFEKDSVAAHASGFAFGVLLPPLYEDPRDPELDLTRVSFQLHRELAESLPQDGGIDFESRHKASVVLALTDDQADQFRAVYRSIEGHDRDVRWLSNSELSHIEARIAPDIPGGFYLGDAYEVEPHKFSLSLWQAAERRGATLVSRAVESISASSGEGVTVVADGETYSAAKVIVAAGPWSSSLLGSCGINVPITPLKGQITRLEAPGPPMRVSFWWDGDYAGSKPDGLVWCGTTEERVGFDEGVTEPARDKIIGSAERVFPFLADAKLARQTACLRPLSPDGLPVIGSIPGKESIVISTGAGRHGIAIGPGMGRAAADIAINGQPSFDISGLDATRFS